MQILNREKKLLRSLGRFYFSTNEMYIVSNRSTLRPVIEHQWNSLYLHRSLVPKVDTKIGEKQIRGEIFIEGKKLLHSFFFFLKLLYSSLLSRIQLSISRNGDEKWRCHFPGHVLLSLFPRGNGDIRWFGSASWFCWGKEGKGRWYFAFNRAIIEGKRRRNSRDGFSAAAPPLETISMLGGG